MSTSSCRLPSCWVPLANGIGKVMGKLECWTQRLVLIFIYHRSNYKRYVLCGFGSFNGHATCSGWFWFTKAEKACALYSSCSHGHLLLWWQHLNLFMGFLKYRKCHCNTAEMKYGKKCGVLCPSNYSWCRVSVYDVYKLVQYSVEDV